MMFGFCVPRSPTIGAAFADAIKLTAPIKPRPTKRILELLYRDPPLFETPPLLFVPPFNWRAALAAGLAVKRERELREPAPRSTARGCRFPIGRGCCVVPYAGSGMPISW